MDDREKEKNIAFFDFYYLGAGAYAIRVKRCTFFVASGIM